MTSRRKGRDVWRRTKKGWACSLGSRGDRVRLFENPKTGYYYRAIWVNGKQDRRSLGTRSRDEALHLGKQLHAALLVPETAAPALTKQVRLGDLCSRFLTECPIFLDNSEKSKREARVQLDIICNAIGSMRDVRTLSENDVNQYEARRRTGGISYGDGRITQAVRQRTVQSDVKLLKQVLFWGASVTLPNGEPLLQRNPIEYVRVKGERDVARPKATNERFDKTLEAMREFCNRYDLESRSLDSERKRQQAARRKTSWVRAELALLLLRMTGRRRGAIAALRWDDIDFENRTITWQGRWSKSGKTRTTRFPPSIFDTLRLFHDRLGGKGGCVFPRSDCVDASIPPQLISQWIEKAERKANLPKLKGGLVHPYRRLWRSEHRRFPLKAVAEAGGWDDVTTMLACYDIPDDEDILAVTSADDVKYQQMLEGCRLTTLLTSPAVENKSPTTLKAQSGFQLPL